MTGWVTQVRRRGNRPSTVNPDGPADHFPDRLRGRRRLRRRLPRGDRADRARHAGDRHQPRDRAPRRPPGVGDPRRLAALRAASASTWRSSIPASAGRGVPVAVRDRRGRAISSSAPTTACCRRRSTSSAARPRRSTSATSPFRLEHPSATFHGRDLFAPVAANLALGKDLAAAGVRSSRRASSASRSPARASSSSAPSPTPSAIDGFGNISLDLSRDDLDGHPLAGAHRVSVGSRKRRRTATRATAFEEVADGGFLFYEDSSGRMAIAVNRGDASEVLDLRVGDVVELRTRPVGRVRSRRRASALPAPPPRGHRLDQPAGEGARRGRRAVGDGRDRRRADRRPRARRPGLDGAARRGAALLGDPPAARPRPPAAAARRPARRLRGMRVAGAGPLRGQVAERRLDRAAQAGRRPDRGPAARAGR